MSRLAQHILEIVKNKTVFTDIRIAQDEAVVIRTPTGWSKSGYIASKDDLTFFLNNIDLNWRDRLKTHEAIDSSIFMEHIRLRCNVFLHQAGHSVGVVIRKLPDHPMALEHTGLPIFVDNFARAPSGLILVSGPTGSGKSTTSASFLERINETRGAHVVTIEEPIEYVFQPKKAVFTQREVGCDVKSFSAGMTEAMRQCPDVIMIGEIRDADTAHAAIRAAESGHLVLATTHAKTAIGAIYKLLSFFGEDSSSKAAALANSLVCVIAQTLLPSIDRKEFVLAAEVLNGRDPQVAGLLASMDRYKQLQDLLAAGRLTHSISFNRSLAQLVAAKKIDEQTARNAYSAFDPQHS
jgi:twitching motility protein PilT